MDGRKFGKISSCGIRWSSFLAVNFPAVTNFEHKNREYLFICLADEAVVANPVADESLHRSNQILAQKAWVRRRE